MVIDGKIDEAFYETVQPASGMIQSEPHAGQPETEKTEIWVFFDEKNLYASIRCWDEHPERWVSNELRRDGPNGSSNESVYFIFDTFHDRRNGFIFGITEAGGLVDTSVTGERDNNRDWNTIFDAKTARFSGGWSAEFSIPFKSLRYAGSGPQTWGFNVRRVIKWKDELLFLAEIPPQLGTIGLLKLSSAATLEGLTLPPTSRLLEAKPYAISSVKTDRTATPGVDNKVQRDLGFDAKMGVTRSLTADFSYNTDFAQVEDDEQQVNLTRFSLFFPEKREFFLEGQGIFTFGGLANRRNTTPGDVPVLFFSRRIGLANGRAVPIIGGARLTGKTGPYTIGAVSIQSDDDAASTSVATNFSVFRIKRDVLGRSSIGFLGTRRSASTVGPGSNETYGIDGVFSFLTDINVNTFFAQTRTPGLNGDDRSYRGQLDYNGDRYAVQLERLSVDRNFNPEVGYLRRHDFKRNQALVRFTPRTRRFESVRKFQYEASVDSFTHHDGRLDTREAAAAFRVDYKNTDQLSVDFSNQAELLTGNFTIFGNVTVPVGEYRYRSLRTSYLFGTQHKLSGVVTYQQGTFYDGRKKTLSFGGGRVEASRRLSFEPGISLNWVTTPLGEFVAKVVTTRAVYAFGPRTFASALVQYNSTNYSISTNARLRWEYQPGSELFVVYSDGRNTLGAGSPKLESRSVIVKITKFFRL